MGVAKIAVINRNSSKPQMLVSVAGVLTIQESLLFASWPDVTLEVDRPD